MFNEEEFFDCSEGVGRMRRVLQRIIHLEVANMTNAISIRTWNNSFIKYSVGMKGETSIKEVREAIAIRRTRADILSATYAAFNSSSVAAMERPRRCCQKAFM